MRALLALAALLALLGPALIAEATLGDNGLTTYTGRKREPNTMVFGNDMVSEQAWEGTLSLTKDLLKGTWKPLKNDPPTEKKEVQLECLNSVAPAPLNWKMWCPGTDAKVVGWIDKSGAAHRQITLRPQKGMTSTMYQWFVTTTVMGLMPPIVEFEGNHYHYYHLWHPLDHVESAWAMGPKVPIMQKGPPVYVLIHERYRNPPNFPYDRHYETNGWFWVEDGVKNLMKNRYVITMPYMGIPTWTMILEFNDTPEGLVVDVEVIAGIPFKGFDDRAPYDGYKMAAGINELFTAPLLAKQKGSYDWEESINAITRHVIEEFSNLQHFVPYLYEKCNLLGKAGINWIPTLGTWLQYHHKSVADGSSISWYHMLEKVAQKQINMTNTAYNHLVDKQIDIWNKTFLAGANMLTTANEHLSRKTFVPISNRLTKASFEANKAHGAHPEVDITLQSIKRGIISKLLEGAEITTETIIVGVPPPPMKVIPAEDTSGASDDDDAKTNEDRTEKQESKAAQQNNKAVEDEGDYDEEEDSSKGQGGNSTTPAQPATAPPKPDQAPSGSPAPTGSQAAAEEDEEGEGDEDEGDEGSKGEESGPKSDSSSPAKQEAPSPQGSAAPPSPDSQAEGEEEDDEEDEDEGANSTDSSSSPQQAPAPATAPVPQGSAAPPSPDTEAESEAEGDEEEEDEEADSTDSSSPQQVPAPAPTPTPTPAPAPQAPESDAPADDAAAPAAQGEGDEGDDEEEDGEDTSADDNPAVRLRAQLKAQNQPPARPWADTDDEGDTADDADAESDGDAAGDMNFESGVLNGTVELQDAAGNSLGPVPHPKTKLKRGIITAIIDAKAQASNASGNASAAMEEPGVSLYNITKMIRGGGKHPHDYAHADAKDVKKQLLAALQNNTIIFNPSNNTLNIPQHVLAALQAKHNLEAATLAALLNGTNFGLSSNVSGFTLPSGALPFGDPSSVHLPAKFVAHAAKHAITGNVLAKVLNASAAGAHVTVKTIPHDIFASLSANGTAGSSSGTSNATADFPRQPGSSKRSGAGLIAALKQDSHQELVGPLKKLGKSINRAAHAAQLLTSSMVVNITTGPVVPLHSLGNATARGRGRRGTKGRRLPIKVQRQRAPH